MSTKVINSRQQKRANHTWRRRECLGCQTIFTTYERISTAEILVTTNPSTEEQLSEAKLLISIAGCFEHAPKRRVANAQDLANTIVTKVIRTYGNKIDSNDLKKLIYTTIRAFDKQASIQYAARYAKDYL